MRFIWPWLWVLTACGGYSVGSPAVSPCVRQVSGAYADELRTALRKLPDLRLDSGCGEPYATVKTGMTRATAALDSAGLATAYTYHYTVDLTQRVRGHDRHVTLNESAAFYRSDSGPEQGLNTERMRSVIAQRLAEQIRNEILLPPE